jgi:hypothetical protein
MASRLINLFRQLNWSDFSGTPPAGTTWAAQTFSGFTASAPLSVRVDAKFQLMDAVTVTVNFNGASSWRIPAMSSWPAQLQQELLEHEQGHYDITALFARDLFIQLMRFKASLWSTAADVASNYNNWVQQYSKILDDAEKAYDNDTGHSQANVFTPSTGTYTPPVPTKSSTQSKWERLIASAFTTPRSPPESAPDGTPYKKQLKDVLIEAGIQL